jgi:hypothetical protein
LGGLAQWHRDEADQDAVGHLQPVRALDHEASPRRIEEQLLAAIRVPTRYPPNVSLEEVDEDGAQLAEEVLAALKPARARSG